MEQPDRPRPRHTKEELRVLLLAAGRAILDEEGLGIGAGALTFKRVFERVEADTGVRVTNASVIRRVWENQADYRTDVLASIAGTAEFEGERDGLLRSLGPMFEHLDVSTPEARLAARREMTRVAGGASFRYLVESREWGLWVGVWVLAATNTPSPSNERIRAAIVEGYGKSTQNWEILLQTLSSILGLRFREPLTLRQFTVSVGAVLEGCALRHVGAEDLTSIERPTGPGGAMQEWTLFAIALEALAVEYFELDPDWQPPTAD